MSKTKELQGELNELRTRAATILEEAGPDLDMSKVKSIDGDSKAKVEAFQALDREINDKWDELKAAETDEGALPGLADTLGKLAQPASHARHVTNGKQARQQADEQQKSLGELFVESVALKEYKTGGGPVAHLDIDLMANLLETATGWAPYDFRSPRLVDFATRPLRVVDLIPQTTTTAASISYMEETTFSNSAAEVAEGGLKPEVSLAFTERNDPVRKIAVWIPVTDEQMADVPRLRGIIDNRLGFMVRQRLDSQILVGDGTAPNLSGILDRTGLQTQALGGDNVPDAVYKGITKILVNAFAEPNAVIFHPNDWQAVRLLKTSDGLYIWGAPMDAGPERIWGLPVARTTAITENTALVGDFQQTELAVRSGVDVQASNSHDDFFIYNKLAIRAEMRAALAVYRPAAFCKITGV